MAGDCIAGTPGHGATCTKPPRELSGRGVGCTVQACAYEKVQILTFVYTYETLMPAVEVRLLVGMDGCTSTHIDILTHICTYTHIHVVSFSICLPGQA